VIVSSSGEEGVEQSVPWSRRRLIAPEWSSQDGKYTGEIATSCRARARPRIRGVRRRPATTNSESAPPTPNSITDRRCRVRSAVPSRQRDRALRKPPLEWRPMLGSAQTPSRVSRWRLRRRSRGDAHPRRRRGSPRPSIAGMQRRPPGQCVIVRGRPPPQMSWSYRARCQDTVPGSHECPPTLPTRPPSSALAILGPGIYGLAASPGSTEPGGGCASDHTR